RHDLILITQKISTPAPRSVINRPSNLQSELLVKSGNIVFAEPNRQLRPFAAQRTRGSDLVAQLDRTPALFDQSQRLVVQQEERDQAASAGLQHAGDLAE